MKARLGAAGVMLLWIHLPAGAHRLDEYLQATIIAVERDRVHAQIRLAPGVAVLPIVLASIDSDGDGVISEVEQRAYGERVLRDLSLRVDGHFLRPRLVSMKFPAIAEMREGRGEIHLEYEMDVPGIGTKRKLVFENHHQSKIAAYLVNCLVPSDPDLHVIAQRRSYEQSFYELDYVQAGGGVGWLPLSWWSGGRGLVGVAALLLFARFAWLWRQQRTRGA